MGHRPLYKWIRLPWLESLVMVRISPHSTQRGARKKRCCKLRRVSFEQNLGRPPVSNLLIVKAGATLWPCGRPSMATLPAVSLGFESTSKYFNFC